jgi:hypothetical protein
MRNAIVCCLVVCAACGSKKDDGTPGAGDPAGATTVGPAGAGAAGTAGSAGASAGGETMTGPGVPPAGGSAATPAGSGAGAGAAGSALATERKTRIFECAFARFEGEGKDRKTVFKLKNLGDRKAERAQSWLYYYDKADKQVRRYPHAFFTGLEAGATEEQALGFSGESIPKETAAVECEVTEVTWSDKTKWANANLSSDAIDRPRGGFSHAQLMEREGEPVTATWNGKAAGPPVFGLKNTGARPLTVKVVWVYQYDAAGKQLERSVSNVSIDLEVGAETEAKLGPKALKPGAKHVEAVVPEVRFRDGKKELWRNDNLAPLGERPMKAAREGAAAAGSAR